MRRPVGWVLGESGARLLEYRRVAASGTVAEPLAALMRRANIARNIAIPRTTGMPHRRATFDFRTLKPYRAALTLVEGCPSLRSPQPRYRRLRFGCRSYRLSPPKDGAAWILPNPRTHTGSRYREIEATRLSDRSRPVPKKSHTNVWLELVSRALQARLRSSGCSRSRRKAPEWIWLIQLSLTPSCAPICFMVHPAKW